MVTAVTTTEYDVRQDETVSAVSASKALHFSILNWSAWTPGRETGAGLAFMGRRRQRRHQRSNAGGSAHAAAAAPRLTSGQRLVGTITAFPARGLPPARYVLEHPVMSELARALATLDAIEADDD